MQGLPANLLSKSSKADAVFGENKASAKAEAGVDGKVEAASGDQKISGDFASLFASLSQVENTENKEGKEKKEGEAKSESTNALQSLLLEKNKESTSSVAVAESAPKNTKTASLEAGKIEQKISQTSSNLDQLLNGLKGVGDNAVEVQEESEEADLFFGLRNKKSGTPVKGEMKSENPLDFIINGPKNKNAGIEAVSPKEVESLLTSKKSSSGEVVMTGEDFLKNIESREMKGQAKLELINGQVVPQKNNAQNLKGYGQGLSLLSEPLIKNTKDLAFKDTKKGASVSAIDELRTPDTKVGAELSAIKQDVIPVMTDAKNNQDQEAQTKTQTKTQANQKVLDLGSINTSNTNEIIKRISDYVEQNQVANRSSLDLAVKHESLGEFKIQVTKNPGQQSSQNMIDMQITTSSKEGHDFFVKNEVSLMKNLSQAGINLSDLRIISSMSESTPFGQSDSRQSSSFSRNQEGSTNQFMSFESDFRSDARGGSERRKELWEEYQQRYGA